MTLEHGTYGVSCLFLSRWAPTARFCSICSDSVADARCTRAAKLDHVGDVGAGLPKHSSSWDSLSYFGNYVYAFKLIISGIPHNVGQISLGIPKKLNSVPNLSLDAGRAVVFSCTCKPQVMSIRCGEDFWLDMFPGGKHGPPQTQHMATEMANVMGWYLTPDG